MLLEIPSPKNGKTLLDQTALPALQIYKKTGVSSGAGFAVCGAGRSGESPRMGGVYQRRKTRLGTRTVLMRTYAPTYRQTTGQQISRIKMQQAMRLWGELADVTKAYWNKRAVRRGKLGRWLFLSEMLKNEYIDTNIAQCGRYVCGYPTIQIT